MHAVVLLPRVDDQIDDRFECLALLVLGEGPEASVDRLAASVERDDAEEEFATTFGGEGIALEVEEDVTGRGLGQTAQPLAVLERPKLEQGRRLAARLELHARLFADAHVGVGGAALRLERQR